MIGLRALKWREALHTHTEGHCRYANREKGREAHNQQISPLNEEKEGVYTSQINEWVTRLGFSLIMKGETIRLCFSWHMKSDIMNKNVCTLFVKTAWQEDK